MNKIEFYQSGKSFEEHGISPVTMAVTTNKLAKNLDITERGLVSILNKLLEKKENENEIYRVKIPYTTALIVHDWNIFFEQLIEAVNEEYLKEITILDVLDELNFFPYSFE